MSSSPGDYTATLPRKRMGSGVVFTSVDSRVLLVEPTYKEYWEVPGGCVEVDESPYAAAMREVKEELGLVVRPGRLLVVDWVPPRENRTEGVMFLYAGGLLSTKDENAIYLPAAELRHWAWSTRTECDARLSRLLARRVAAALRALQNGEIFYLEDGRLVS
jgi:8-oxo-dGTP diphosphatase